MAICIYESDGGTKQRTINELTKFRDELPSQVAMELDEIWQKIRDKAIELCPKLSGALASSIELESEGGSGAIGARGDGDFYSNAIYAGNDQTFNSEGVPTSQYAQLVHDGHATRDGGFFEGIPFLEDALAAYASELDSCVDRAMKEMGVIGYD